jgi:fibro-slime domain-containing protein
VVGAPVTLSLTGDDDAWLFLGGSLLLDNGGVKATSGATTTTTTLGVGTYTADLLFADRHVVQSGITFSCVDAPGGGTGACVDPVLEPIPEPATLLLFGTTLVGLGAVVRRRMKGRSNIDA